MFFSRVSSGDFCALADGALAVAGGLGSGGAFHFLASQRVNLALALLFGRRFIPLILLNIPISVFLFGEPVLYGSVGATTNLLETFFGACLLNRFGKLDAGMDSLKSTRIVIGLACVSLAAPLVTATGLTAVATLGGRHLEAGLLVLATLLAGWFGFVELPKEVPNTLFLIFVVVAFAASRFGSREVALLNLLTMIMIYAAMILNADLFPAGSSSRVLWLLPSFV